MNKCDCLNQCGDDPDILNMKVEPCLCFARCHLEFCATHKLVPEDELIPLLQEDAVNKLKAAEKAWHLLFSNMPVGEGRIKAAEVFENIRNAARVGG